MPERVIIDTDPGIDDALALLLALRSPELDVRAITTVSGNVPVDVATRNVLTVLSLLPPDRRPPVARGASAPLQKQPTYATSVHGDDGLGGVHRYRDSLGRLRYTPPGVTYSRRGAVGEMLHHIRTTAEPCTLIALGPLTNIAQAIQMDSATMAGLKRVVVMGGAFTVPGNVTPAAEFNIFVDPHAARHVFYAGIPLTVVGLDVTRRVRLTRETVEKKVAPRQTRISRFVCDCTASLFGFCEEREEGAGFCLHDPLAVGAVIDPSLVVCESMHVDVETGDDLNQGMTVADRHPLRGSARQGPNAEVCLDVDAPRFLSLFLERLCPASSSSEAPIRI